MFLSAGVGNAPGGSNELPDMGGVPADGLLTSQLLPGFATGGLPLNSSVPAAAARRHTWVSRFLPERVYEYYSRQQVLAASALPAGHARLLEIPPEFTSVLPLDRQASHDSSVSVTGSFGYVSSIYKVISVNDGMAYALRRVENVRATPAVLEGAVKAWARAAHPSIVTLRRAFPGAAGAGGGIYFLHDYYPGARTLRELYLDVRGPPVAEKTMWSIVCQCVAGLRAAHDAGLSFHGVHATHVLVTGHNRVRFSGAGVLDVLESDSRKTLAEKQQADMLGFGHMLLQLAVRLSSAHSNVSAALESVQQSYSPALHALIVLLLSKPVPVHDICRLLAPQLLAELDGMYDHADAMDNLLAREADNGRMFRLLVKLGLINERPHYEGDPAWSDTGDRYLLKLYRDFLFHQVNDEGKPVIDLAHIVESLNALDAGSPQRILLSSRDGGSLLVSSYGTLRRAVNSSYDDLRLAVRNSSAPDAAGDTSSAAGNSGRPRIFRGRGGGRGGAAGAVFSHNRGARLARSVGGPPGGLMGLPGMPGMGGVGGLPGLGGLHGGFHGLGGPMGGGAPGSDVAAAAAAAAGMLSLPGDMQHSHSGGMTLPMGLHNAFGIDFAAAMQGAGVHQLSGLQQQQQQQQQQQFQDSGGQVGPHDGSGGDAEGTVGMEEGGEVHAMQQLSLEDGHQLQLENGGGMYADGSYSGGGDGGGGTEGVDEGSSSNSSSNDDMSLQQGEGGVADDGAEHQGNFNFVGTGGGGAAGEEVDATGSGGSTPAPSSWGLYSVSAAPYYPTGAPQEGALSQQQSGVGDDNERHDHDESADAQQQQQQPLLHVGLSAGAAEFVVGSRGGDRSRSTSAGLEADAALEETGTAPPPPEGGAEETEASSSEPSPNTMVPALASVLARARPWEPPGRRTDATATAVAVAVPSSFAGGAGSREFVPSAAAVEYSLDFAPPVITTAEDFAPAATSSSDDFTSDAPATSAAPAAGDNAAAVTVGEAIGASSADDVGDGPATAEATASMNVLAREFKPSWA